jgi:hypothetical protein
MSKYADIFEGLGKLSGTVHLQVDPSVEPVQFPARRLPLPIKKQVETELKQMVANNVIAPVTEPTKFSSPMVVVRKPTNGQIRICLDPKAGLNKALSRQHYPMPVLDDILPLLSNAKIFTTVDAKSAYWMCTLDDESSKLCTMSTPFGRFKWLRMPYGISCASEIFQRKIHQELEGLDGIACIADDILIFGCGDTLDQAKSDHDVKLTALLERCRMKNIKLNKDKLRLNRDSVPYMGHILTQSGIKIDNSKLSAVINMPAPTDRQGVMRLLGMATYLARWVPGFSEITAPIRQLLSTNVEFRWENDVQGVAFQRLKSLLTAAPVLQFYDANKPAKVQCDSSQYAVAACLMQDDRPIEYASRSLTSTEIGYAQIEKEMLAIVFAMERFHSYVYGRHVTVETDHRPLISINKKALSSAPKRLQRMLLRLQNYDFDLVFKLGSQVVVADTLSRAVPTVSPNVESTQFNEELCLVNEEQMFEIKLVTSDKTLKSIRDAANNDKQYQTLKQQIATGWPAQSTEVVAELKEFYPFADELVVCDDLVFKGQRLFVPTALRHNMMEIVHSSHIGINGCIRRAREVLFWPGQVKDLQQYISKCQICQEYQTAQQKENLLSHEVPLRPWEKVGIDIFTFHDKNYLILSDYLSSYFEVDRLNSKSMKDVIYCLKSQFARHGIPNIVFSDNAFNNYEFQKFAETYDFEQRFSSPRYPQSNGKVENAVKICKSLMTKAVESKSDPFLALLDWRNTPSEQLKESPAQILFGRRTRTRIPTSELLLTTPHTETVRNALYGAKQRQAKYYNQHAKHRSTQRSVLHLM